MECFLQYIIDGSDCAVNRRYITHNYKRAGKSIYKYNLYLRRLCCNIGAYNCRLTRCDCHYSERAPALTDNAEFCI